MSFLKNQSGVSLIAAIFIIVILAFMGMVFLTLFTATSSTSINELQSTQALYVAEGGMERAVYQYRKDGTACAALVNNNIPLGSGNFTTTGTLYSTSPSTTLSGAIGAGDTIIPAVSTAGYAPNGRIRIDSEDINYSSIAGNTFTGAQRGAGGTTAVAHAFGATALQSQCTINSTGVVGNARRAVEKAIQQNYDAMIVYAKANGDGTPYFRRWNGTSWGAELTATAVPADIHFFVLKFARTRNEAVLGTLSSNGDIRVQIWNGNTQIWSATTLLANVGAGDSAYRGFDIEYETIGDRAIVVYNDNSADPNYRIWDGTAWSGATNINLPTTGEAFWIELSLNPLNDEIAMITLDANYDVKGMRWPGGGASGAAWDEMGGLGTWDTSAANDCPVSVNFCKVIDVAYEQLSGRAMFIWGDNANGLQRYRIWNGATSTLDPPSDLDLTSIPGSDMNGEANWLRLVARPNSNELLYGVQDENRDLFTARWTGASPWVSPIRHDGSTEDVNNRNFDIVYETHSANPGIAWIVWGEGTVVRQNRWNGAAWAGSGTIGGTADTALVQLLAHPFSGAVFAAIYEDQSSGGAERDILEMRLTNGAAAWACCSLIWGGPTVNDPVHERVVIAPERYSPTVGWREVFQ